MTIEVFLAKTGYFQNYKKSDKGPCALDHSFRLNFFVLKLDDDMDICQHCLEDMYRPSYTLPQLEIFILTLFQRILKYYRTQQMAPTQSTKL